MKTTCADCGKKSESRDVFQIDYSQMFPFGEVEISGLFCLKCYMKRTQKMAVYAKNEVI